MNSICKLLSATSFFLLASVSTLFSQDCETAKDCFLKGLEKGNTLEAIACFDKAQSMTSEVNDQRLVIDILSTRGNIYFTLEDYTKAIQDYNKIIQLRPEEKRLLAVAYSQRGSVMSANGNANGALASYTKAIETFPPNMLNLYKRGSHQMNKGKKEEAVADFKKMADLGSNSALYYIYEVTGEDYSEQQKVALAKDEYWQEMEGEIAMAKELLGAKEYQKSYDIYLKVGDMYLSRNDRENSNEMWTEMSYIKLMQEEYDRTIQWASQVINSSYPKSYAFYTLSYAYFKLGRSIEALNVCDSGLKRFENNKTISKLGNYIAGVEAGKAYADKDYNSSYSLYFAAFTYNPKDAESIKYAGHSAYAAGGYKEALACYEKAVAADASQLGELQQFIDYCRTK